jgi:hypothetical protein
MRLRRTRRWATRLRPPEDEEPAVEQFDPWVRRRGTDWVWTWTRDTALPSTWTDPLIEIRTGPERESPLLATSAPGPAEGIAAIDLSDMELVTPPLKWSFKIGIDDTMLIPEGSPYLEEFVSIEGMGLTSIRHKLLVVT